MNSYEQLFEKIKVFADESELVDAMVLFGSRARKEHCADEYSDYDIILFVKDVDYFINSDKWLLKIGNLQISFVEPTAVQDFEKRVFFEDSMDVDFIIYNSADADRITSDEIIKSWYSKGYSIITDKMNYKQIAEKYAPYIRKNKVLSEKEFINTVNIFWFHTIWAIKKLRRGEVWAAKNCIDGYLKNLLLEVLSYDALIRNGEGFDTWHDGRFFDEWADKTVLQQLSDAYGRYDAKSLQDALLHTMDIFYVLSLKTSQALGYKYPERERQYAFNEVNKKLI